MGGWDDAGRARFVELRQKIEAAKQKEHVHSLETTLLKEIQDKHSKVQVEGEEEEGQGPNEESEFINELLADSKEIVGEEVVLEDGEASDVEDLEDDFQLAKKKKVACVLLIHLCGNCCLGYPRIHPFSLAFIPPPLHQILTAIATIHARATSSSFLSLANVLLQDSNNLLSVFKYFLVP